MGFPPGSTWSRYVSIRRISAGKRAAVQKEYRLSRHVPLPRPILLCMGLFSIFVSGACGAPPHCRTRATKIAASFRAIPPTSGARYRVRKQDLDQRAGTAASLDLEFSAVGFDQGLGQRQADGRALGPIRRRRRPERLKRGGNLIVVEAMAGVADPQHHLAEIG